MKRALTHARALAIVGALSLLPLAALAQQPQSPAPSGRGRIGGIGIGAYPQRTVEDKAAVERGRSAFSANCAFCHGADIRGGDGGPSLLRSSVVLDDKSGELIGPVIRAGRPDRGMPAFAMTPEQIADIAAFMHSFTVAGLRSVARSSGLDPGRQRRRGGTTLRVDVRFMPLDDR